MKSFQSIYLFVFCAWFFASGCSEIRPLGSKLSRNSSQSSTVDPNELYCDPLNPQSLVDARFGIKSSLYYFEEEPKFETSAEYIAQGKKFNADIYLSDLNVTPRDFSLGFSARTGESIKKANGEILTEFFALEGESQLQLAPSDAEGTYQLAAIADDGITVLLKGASGWAPVITDEGMHNARLACAGSLVSMTRSKTIPLRFRYFQGVRKRLALMLMWRKVDAAKMPTESECSMSPSDDHFFSGNPSTARAPYDALLSRGWKPLVSANYRIPEGVNQCAN